MREFLSFVGKCLGCSALVIAVLVIYSLLVGTPVHAQVRSALPVAACRSFAGIDVLVRARLGGANMGQAVIAANQGGIDQYCMLTSIWVRRDYGPPVRTLLLDGHVFEVRVVALPLIDGRGYKRFESRAALVLAPIYEL